MTNLKEGLRVTAGAAAFAGLAYFLSRFVTFTGKNFRTQGLTDAQVAAMDNHNARHSRQERLKNWGAQLVLSVTDPSLIKDAESNLERINAEADQQMKLLMDADTKDLPPPLNHTH